MKISAYTKKFTEVTISDKKYKLVRPYYATRTGLIYTIINDNCVFLNQTENSYGYLHVSLTTTEGSIRAKVHRIIATLFVPNEDTEKYDTINHKDENKHNNNADNLEWVTRAENAWYSMNLHPEKWNLHGTDERTPEAIFNRICTDYENGMEVKDIAENYHLSYNLVYDLITGRRHKNISEKFPLIEKERRFSISIADVHKICQALQEGKLAVDISKDTGVPEETINNIYYGRTYKEISCKYKFPEHIIGEAISGDANYRALVTNDTIHEVCKDMEKGMNNTSLLEKYSSKGINSIHLTNIRTGNSWKSISSQYNIPNHSNRGSLTDEDFENICKDLVAGLSASEIAAKYGTTVKNVCDIKTKKCHCNISDKYFKEPMVGRISNAGRSHTNTWISDENLIELCKDLAAGETPWKLQKKYNTNATNIYRVRDKKIFKEISDKYF